MTDTRISQWKTDALALLSDTATPASIQPSEHRALTARLADFIDTIFATLDGDSASTSDKLALSHLIDSTPTSVNIANQTIQFPNNADTQGTIFVNTSIDITLPSNLIDDGTTINRLSFLLRTSTTGSFGSISPHAYISITQGSETTAEQYYDLSPGRAAERFSFELPNTTASATINIRSVYTPVAEQDFTRDITFTESQVLASGVLYESVKNLIDARINAETGTIPEDIHLLQQIVAQIKAISDANKIKTDLLKVVQEENEDDNFVDFYLEGGSSRVSELVVAETPVIIGYRGDLSTAGELKILKTNVNPAVELTVGEVEYSLFRENEDGGDSSYFFAPVNGVVAGDTIKTEHFIITTESKLDLEIRLENLERKFTPLPDTLKGWSAHLRESRQTDHHYRSQDDSLAHISHAFSYEAGAVLNNRFAVGDATNNPYPSITKATNNPYVIDFKQDTLSPLVLGISRFNARAALIGAGEGLIDISLENGNTYHPLIGVDENNMLYLRVVATRESDSTQSVTVGARFQGSNISEVLNHDPANHHPDAAFAFSILGLDTEYNPVTDSFVAATAPTTINTHIEVYANGNPEGVFDEAYIISNLGADGANVPFSYTDANITVTQNQRYLAATHELQYEVTFNVNPRSLTRYEAIYTATRTYDVPVHTPLTYRNVPLGISLDEADDGEFLIYLEPSPNVSVQSDLIISALFKPVSSDNISIIARESFGMPAFHYKPVLRIHDNLLVDSNFTNVRGALLNENRTDDQLRAMIRLSPDLPLYNLVADDADIYDKFALDGAVLELTRLNVASNSGSGFYMVAEEGHIRFRNSSDDSLIQELPITVTGSGTLEAGSVTSTHLATGSVLTAKLADDAVTTGKIADGAVTADKLASGAVMISESALQTAIADLPEANPMYYNTQFVQPGRNTDGTAMPLGKQGIPFFVDSSGRPLTSQDVSTPLRTGDFTLEITSPNQQVPGRILADIPFMTFWGGDLILDITGGSSTDFMEVIFRFTHFAGLPHEFSHERPFNLRLFGSDEVTIPLAAFNSLTTLSASQSQASTHADNIPIKMEIICKLFSDATHNTVRRASTSLDVDMTVSNAEVSFLQWRPIVGPRGESASTADISDLSVTSGKLANGAVTTDKILNGAVTSSKIANGTITTEDIADDAITADKIADTVLSGIGVADESITAVKLADNAVITVKINDNAVTTAKINTGAVTTAKLGNNAVTSAKISSGAVGTAQIANDSITGEKIRVGTITANKLASGVLNFTIAPGTITGTQIAGNTITSANIGGNQITNTELANNAVESDNILDGTIQGRDIQNATITQDKLAAGVGGGASELNELNDVVINNPSNNQIIAYEDTSVSFVRSLTLRNQLSNSPRRAATTSDDDVWVVTNSSGTSNDSVDLYNGTTGSYIRHLNLRSSFLHPVSATVTSNGDVWVCNATAVELYNGTTGAYIRSLTLSNQPSEINDIVVDSNGDVWVIGTGTSKAQLYNGATGALIRTLSISVSTTQNLNIEITSDGNLMILSHSNSSSFESTLAVYNNTTGAVVRTLITTTDSALEGIGITSDGNVWVTVFPRVDSNAVQLHNGTTGAYIKSLNLLSSGHNAPTDIALTSTDGVWVTDNHDGVRLYGGGQDSVWVNMDLSSVSGSANNSRQIYTAYPIAETDLKSDGTPKNTAANKQGGVIKTSMDIDVRNVSGFEVLTITYGRLDKDLPGYKVNSSGETIWEQVTVPIKSLIEGEPARNYKKSSGVKLSVVREDIYIRISASTTGASGSGNAGIAEVIAH